MTDPTDNQAADQAPSLRDRLAVQRTELANERTLLAYGRTAFMLASTGVLVLRVYSDSLWMRVLGIVLIAAGMGVTAIGGWRFVSMRRRLTE